MTSGEQTKRPGQVFPMFPYWCRPRSNYSFSKNKVYDIERENLRLLRELCRLNPRTRPVSTATPSNTNPILKVYHTGRNRHHKLQRIESENLAALKRLHSTKSTPAVRCSEQLEDYQRLASYPGTPSLFKYKPPKSSRAAGLAKRLSLKPPARPGPHYDEDKEAENAILEELQRRLLEDVPSSVISRPSETEKPVRGPEEDDNVDENEDEHPEPPLGFGEYIRQKVVDAYHYVTGASTEDGATESSSVTDVNQSVDPTQGADGGLQQQSEDKNFVAGKRKHKDKASVAESSDHDSFPNEVSRINHENMQLLRALPRTYSYYAGHNQHWAQQGMEEGMEKDYLSVLKRSTPALRRAKQLEDYQEYAHSPRVAQYPGHQALGKYDNMMAAYASSPIPKPVKVRVPRPSWID